MSFRHPDNTNSKINIFSLHGTNEIIQMSLLRAGIWRLPSPFFKFIQSTPQNVRYPFQYLATRTGIIGQW